MELKNHFSLTSSSEVGQVCNAALNSIGITYFNYIKIYNDGSRELLTNNSPWIDHFYQKKLYKTAGAVDIEYLLPKGYFLWSELQTDDAAYSQGRDLFNIDNGISFVSRNKNSTTLYIFGSERQNHKINNFYVRNIDLMKRFIMYFNDKGQDLLRKSKENKIYLPERQIINNKKLVKIDISEKDRKNFMQQTEISRYYIPHHENNLYLTKKEAECIRYIIDGSTAKQAARNMGISFRTVESHISNIKEKLQCTTKEKIVEILLEANIHDIISRNK